MKYIYIIIALVVVVLAAVALTVAPSFEVTKTNDPDTNTLITEDDLDMRDTTTSDDVEEAEPAPAIMRQSIIGQSVNGTDITAYHYGSGERELLLIGGIHGGYSWNTSALAYTVMDYLETVAENLQDVQVTVIPTLNPDGLEEVFGTATNVNFASAPASVEATIPGRFNANNVDLNRNFNCEWQPQATWQNRAVSGGTEPFSEPETHAIREYVNANQIASAIVWYSAAGGVYSSSCRNGVLDATTNLTDIYATAADYPAFEEYDYYEITGDMVNWFASQNIPGISVLLSDHRSTESGQNIAGVEAAIKYLQSN